MHIHDGCLDEGIRVVDVRNEQAAVFAADAWTRLVGRPGVAAVTSGPGFAPAARLAKPEGQVLLLLGAGAAWTQIRRLQVRPALERAFESGLPALVNVEMGTSAFRAGAVSV